MKKSQEAYEALVTMVRTVIISRIKGDSKTEASAESSRDEALESLKTAIEDDVMEALELAALAAPREVPTVVEPKVSEAPRKRRQARAGASKSKRAKRGGGDKRSPDELEAVMGKLAALVKKSPGLRMEEIGKRLGLATKDLALPARKLIASKALKTKGQKRATTYWAR